jgi:hypothetical protein
MVQYKELIVFLLNDVVLKLFDMRNANGRSNSNHNLSFANQLKKIQETEVYLDREDSMEFSQVSTPMHESGISTNRMKSQGRK